MCVLGVCAGEVCAGEECAGEVCAGEVCAGEVCAGEVCVGRCTATLVIRRLTWEVYTTTNFVVVCGGLASEVGKLF